MLGIFLGGQSLRRISTLGAPGVVTKDWGKILSVPGTAIQIKLGCSCTTFPHEQERRLCENNPSAQSAFGSNLFLE